MPYADLCPYASYAYTPLCLMPIYADMPTIYARMPYTRTPYADWCRLVPVDT
jgi:hypothetical protein